MPKLTPCRLLQTVGRLLLLANQKAGRKGLGSSIGSRGGQSRLGGDLSMDHEVVQRAQSRLNVFQPARKISDLFPTAGIVEMLEEIESVADLLDLDPELMA